MAAILKLRRGTSFTSLQESELFYDTSLGTILLGDGGGSNTTYKTLTKLNESNSGSFYILGDITGSHFSASGDISASNLELQGDANIAGNIVLGGDIFLGDGDSSTDNININASLSGSLIPQTDNIFSLGTISSRYSNLFVVSASIEDIQVPGSGILSSSVTNFTDYSSSVDTRLDNSELTGSNHRNRIEEVEATGSNHRGRVEDLEATGSDHETRMNNAEVSGSNHRGRIVLLETTGSDHESRLDTIEGAFSTSVDLRLDNAESSGSNHRGRIVLLETTGSDHESRLDVIEGAFSTSVDSRLDELEGPFSTSVDSRLDLQEADSASLDSRYEEKSNATHTIFSGSSQVNANTITNFDSNVKDKLNTETVISGSEQVNLDHLDTGDLAEGSNLYYTDARVKTKLNTETVISGSSQVPMGGDISGNADNATVDKVKGVSLTSGEATQISNINSVTISNTQWGHLGASNQGIATTDNVTFADGDFTGNVQVTGNLTVLGSATEISSTELRIEDKLITVASGSADSAAADGAGIEIDGANKSLVWDHNTSQFVFDAQVSSSVGFKGEGGLLTGIDTDQVTEATNLYYTDARVKTKLNSENVHSGSYLGTSTTTNLSEGTNLYYTDTRVKTKLNTEGVISGSSQVNANTITNFDSNVKAKLDADTVISGSSQVVLNDADKTGFNTADVVEDSSNLYYTDVRVKTKLNTEGVISGSSQVNANTITNFDSNVKAKLDADGVISGSSQISLAGFSTDDLSEGSNLYYTDTRVKTKLNTEGVISGSSQVNANTITNFDSNVDARMNAKTVVSGSTFSSPLQGTVRATINGSNTDVDTGLQSGDSPTFTGLTLSSLDSGVSSNLDAIFDVSGVLKKRTLGTAAFFNVSSSVADDPNSIPTNAAVDAALVAAGAGDITAVNDSSLYSSTNTGIKHTTQGTEVGGEYGQQGNIVLAIDTGSSHFQEGVELYSSTLPSGVVSGSTQIVNVLNTEGVISGSSQISLSTDDVSEVVGASNLYYTDARVKTKLNADGVISGSVQVDVTQTTNYSSINQYTDSDNTDHLNSLGVLSGSGQLTTDFDTRYLNTGGDSVVSGSSQINSLFVGTAVSTSIDDRLDTLEGESHENPLTFSDTDNIDLIRTTNTITANIKGGVISGSSQVNDAFIGTSVSTSLDSRIGSLETDSHTHTNKSNLDSINQDLNTTDNVQFGDLLLSGDLTVQGTTVTLNTAELNIEDKLISVASGSTTPAQADGAGLHISGADESITWDNGNSRFNISDDVYAVGTIKASSDIVAYASSDIQLKNNIKPIENPLEKINQISGNSFVWNEEKQNIYKGKDYGVIAQEIEEILPELVQTRQDGYKAVKYDKLVSLLIEGIKHLNNEVNELKGKIK